MLCQAETEAEKFRIRVLLLNALLILASRKRLGPGYVLSAQERGVLERTNEIFSQIHLADVFLKQGPSDPKNAPTEFELFLWGCWCNVMKSTGQIAIPDLQNYLKNMDGKVAEVQGSLFFSALHKMRNELK